MLALQGGGVNRGQRFLSSAGDCSGTPLSRQISGTGHNAMRTGKPKILYKFSHNLAWRVVSPFMSGRWRALCPSFTAFPTRASIAPNIFTQGEQAPLHLALKLVPRLVQPRIHS